jgi:hypothetical protein
MNDVGASSTWLTNYPPATRPLTYESLTQARNVLAANNIPPAPRPPTVARVGGYDYHPVEIQTDVDHNHYGQRITIRFQAQPVYQTYQPYTLTPTYYTGNQMAISPQTNMTWNNWVEPQYYTGNIGTNNYQTYAPVQSEVTWTGWVSQLELNHRGINGQDYYMQEMTARAAAEINAQFAPRQLTPEEIEANRIAEDQRRHQAALRRAESERIHAEARMAQDTALRRATETFVGTLNDEERESYEKEKCIYVKSQHGRRYRIRCGGGQSGNVELLDHTGQRRAAFCVHPAYQSNGHLLPDPDAWLTQKLYLEHFEDTLLEKANLTFGQRPGREELILPGNHGNPARLVAA